MQETEGKRAPADRDAIESGQPGEAGRAPPDATARKSWRVLVWGLTLGGVCLVGASLALAAFGLPVPIYPGWTADLVVATPLLVLGGLICARKPQERMGKILLALGMVGSVQFAAGEYATYSVLGRSGRLFATGAAGWVSSVAQRLSLSCKRWSRRSSPARAVAVAWNRWTSHPT